jgi:hypothetical protein
MMTEEHRFRRLEWANAHTDDNWSQTVFSDETSFQLFRNTVRRWSKNPQAEVKRIPKTQQKIMVWGCNQYKWEDWALHVREDHECQAVY